MFDAIKLRKRYRKLIPTEITTKQFGARIESCNLCESRKGKQCTVYQEDCARYARSGNNYCELWGEVSPSVCRLKEWQAEFKEKKIRLGVCMPNMAMGGVTRLLLTMMDTQVDHGLEWSGFAIGNSEVFDIETAKRILRYCPIYCTRNDPKFQGLVTVVKNACQKVVDESDLVNLWGYTKSNDEIDSTNWNSKPSLVISHGQCEWTRKNLSVSLSKGSMHVLVAVSEAAGECIQEATRKPYAVIYNAVDFSRCAPSRDRDEVRREWGISPEAKAVGYIGRFAMDKNPLATAKAVAGLGKGFHAVYVGEGWQSDQVIAETKALCGDRLTIVPRVEDIGTVLAALDCVVTAATYEGGPLVAAEAWLAGCPVVSTPAGMIPELERDHGSLVYGVPFDPSVIELTDAVLDAITGDERIERAKYVAWKLFSPGRLITRYESAIRGGC
ncbi:Putative teichuronic acid biosynthesis glycosyltransferase TuaC [Gimesia alba]|uniref:Teichuronic acid biosynthesis glycosyltransferase TuaC n=1 Tax=Gimesia alba TaxID=2527973 RepID=A0A517RB36_9PLAN|nr:glycosyltransferase family 4 protein [Gimesia alba]QDT41054.1 Putative teichuronic acid biosynthesis glycosyltransferase TuaC [Gimesia alba]